MAIDVMNNLYPFPDQIALGSVSIPTYFTDVLRIESGYEVRDQKYDYPRSAYDVGYGVRDIDDLVDLLAYFHHVKGRRSGFCFKDYADYKSCNVDEEISDTDQTIGTGDGDETDFQAVKIYSKGALTRTRKITRLLPEQYNGDVAADSQVTVSVDDVHQTYEDDWDYDYDTGIIYLSVPPDEGAVIKAGFHFYVPVRFDVDALEIGIETPDLAETRIPLVEILE